MKKGLFRNIIVALCLSVGFALIPKPVMAAEEYWDVDEAKLVEIFMEMGYRESTAQSFAADIFKDKTLIGYLVVEGNSIEMYGTVRKEETTGGEGEQSTEASNEATTEAYTQETTEQIETTTQQTEPATEQPTERVTESEEEYMRRKAAEIGAIYCGSYEEAVQLIESSTCQRSWQSDEEIKLFTSKEVGEALSERYWSSCYKMLYHSYQEVFAPRMVSYFPGNYALMSFLLGSSEETRNRMMTQDMYNACIAKINELGPQLRGNTTVETIANVYYYLLRSCSYDYSYSYGDPYHVLYNGTGVCMGYATAFQLFMEYYGIESVIDCSTNHAWNAVRVDGTWYWVDATWGDSAGKESAWLLAGTNMRQDAHGIGVSPSAYSGNKSGTQANTTQTTQQNTQTSSTKEEEKTSASASEAETENASDTETMTEEDSEEKLQQESKAVTLTEAMLLKRMGERETATEEENFEKATSFDKTDMRAENLPDDSEDMVNAMFGIAFIGGGAFALLGGVAGVIVLVRRKNRSAS